MFAPRIVLLSFQSLKANTLRTLLATIGVIIGVGAVVCANGVLEGARRNFKGKLATLGTNTVYVTPAVARRGGRPVGIFRSLTLEDVDSIRSEVSDLQRVAPEIGRTGQIKYLSRNDEVQIVGTSEEFFDIYNVELASGQLWGAQEVGSEAKVAVLGHSIAQELFAHPDAGIGQSIKLGVGNVTGFRVVGVLKEKGQKGARNMDELAIVPVTTAQRSIVGIRHVDMITVQVVSSGKLAGVIGNIKKVLRRLHRIRAGDEDDFQIQNPQEMVKISNDFMQIWALVLYIISGISLVVGGTGIMNIMLVSVTERTREIGVRIAVGARGWDILKQFLVESSVISLMGGALGALMGFAFLDLITQLTQGVVKTHTTWQAVIVALLVSAIIGIVSGLYPAYKASRLDPVEALRHE